MIADQNTISVNTFARGSVTSAEKEIAPDYLAEGSENVIISGAGRTQIFNGATLRAGKSGGSVFSNVVETFASLGQASDTTAYGSVYNVFAALFFIGAGLLRLYGTSLLVNASSTLSLLIKVNGTYTDVASGIFQAGLAQPSAPTIRAIAPPAGFTGKNNGVVSVVAWRVRSTTGARSIKSNVSNIAAATNQSIAVTLPLPDANGQDYWGIGVTKNIEGEIGSHFELVEISEATVSESIAKTDIATDNTLNDISSASGGFTSNQIGWRVSIPSQSFTSYVTAVPSPTALTLADIPPTTASGQVATIQRAVGGQVRTVVIEWRDGDLAGKGFAPTRDFPPPAALFSGTLEDISFVDGAYPDAVQSVSSTVRGSAIAPSERGRPESFSPDTAIFTNDQPTALVRGEGVYWRFGANSTHIIRYLGGDRPLSVEPVWEKIGIDNQNNIVLGEGGRPYLWAGMPVRMGADGMPDSSFVNNIVTDFNAWTDPKEIKVGWHNKNFAAVAYARQKKMRLFLPAYGTWSSWLNLDGIITGNIKSFVTENNALVISTSDGATDRLYDFNIGAGTIAKFQTGWTPARQRYDTVFAVSITARVSSLTPITIETLADGIDAPADTEVITPTRTGYQRLALVRPNVIDCEQTAIRVTMQGNDTAGLESVAVMGDGSSIY